MNRSILIAGCRLYDAPAAAAPVDILVRDGVIAWIGESGRAPERAPVLDAGGRTLIPGLIDVHIHGAGGADVLDAAPEALETTARALARLGTTSFLGTTFMQPAARNRHLPVAAELVGRRPGGANLLGLHLEGPFINPARKGGIPLPAIYPPTPAALEEVLALTDGALRMMTIAPELEGGLEVIEKLTARGVIASFGHSDATYEETMAGIGAGIRHATHLYNAMPGLHHRLPGPFVAIHEDGRLPVQLIADDVHVNRHVVRWTREVFGDERVVCITDGMRTVGLPDGRYRFGEKEYESRDGAARYLDGTLIGTSLSLLRIALRYHEYTGCSFAAAIDSASRAPARALGIDDRKGSIAVGMDADLVLLDEDWSVWATLVGGERDSG